MAHITMTTTAHVNSAIMRQRDRIISMIDALVTVGGDAVCAHQYSLQPKRADRQLIARGYSVCERKERGGPFNAISPIFATIHIVVAFHFIYLR